MTTSADPRIDATRAELERTAKVHHAAQEHHDGLTARQSAAVEALQQAKLARKAAKAELARSEKIVLAEQATLRSLDEQVNVSRKLAAKTQADVAAVERRHNDLLSKAAKRAEKEAAEAARQEAEQARADAKKARQQALREAEERAKEDEHRSREEAEKRAAQQLERAEQEAEQTRSTAAKRAAALAGGDSRPTRARANTSGQARTTSSRTRAVSTAQRATTPRKTTSRTSTARTSAPRSRAPKQT